MPNYNDAQGVADLLSQFDFNIISEGPGDFSPSHRKYTCEFSKPGIEPFTTTYQSNPDVHGQPTATDVFAALASDALAVDGLLVDTFADELGFEKPSQAIRAYESCHKTLDWLKNDMQLMTSEISDIAETLDNELDEVKEEGERYGAGGGFVYGKALSNDCQLYGHGLPLVEFYDVSQDPAKFPEGQFVSRYFMSTLLGMDSIGDIASERCRHSASMAVCRIGPSGAMTCRRSMRTSAPHASNLNLTPSAGLIRITASDSMRKRGRCRVTSSVSQSRKDGGCSSATMTSQTVTPTTTSPMTY